MADLINFVSKTEIDAKKEQRRQARKAVLSKAKDDFYREQRKKERRKETGESSWMLPCLSKRIKDDADSNAQGKLDKKKCKKAKKQKKDKKEKKHKKSKQDVSQHGISSESESEDEWVEKGAANVGINSSLNNDPLQRDSWMLCPPLRSELNRPVKGVEENEELWEEKKEVEDETKKLTCMDQPGQHCRELNPYWKDGGTGLPSERDAVTLEAAVNKGTVSSFNSKWLEKAYQRAKEQAQEEGRSVVAVVAERWGSVERLESLIKEAQQRERSQNTAVSRVTGIERYRGGYDKRDNRRHSTEKRAERDEEKRSHAEASSDTGRYGSSRKTSQERLKKMMEIDSETRQRTNDEVKKFLHPTHRGDSSSFAGKFMRPPSSASVSTSSSWDFADSNVQSRRQPGVSARGTSFKISGGWRKKTVADAEPAVEPKGAETIEKAEVVQGASASHGSESSSSCYESEDEEELRHKEEAVPTQKITEADLNEIGAKIVKAEILGNEELSAKLKSQLEGMRKTKQLQGKRAKGSQSRGNTEEVVILTRSDAAGNVRPVEMVSTPEPREGRRKRKKVETHSKEGKRERYFADDDRYDLKEMVRREKMRTTEDHNAMLARLSSKASTMTNSDDFTLDDHFVSSAASKLSPAQLEEREKQKAIKEHRLLAAQLAKCRFCFENPDIAKHLLIAIGIKVYLALPLHESLTQGHCLIVPMQHCSASTLLDEDVWSEIQIYKKGLTKMFEEMEEDVVFLETCKQLKKQHHMIIECIPLSKEAGEMAPIYFKKAIMESDAEWAQNKKLIDTRKKGLQASIPRGLPYFSVEFGLDGGFAHVIEEEELFPHYFGKEIVGGMLDLEPRRWRKPRRENFEEHKKKVLQFADWWKPFDWTRKLDRTTS